MTYDVALCHPDEITNLIPKSSGWLSYSQYLIRMTYRRCIMSSGWLTWRWYPIRMSYGNVIMSSGWDTLPLLSHPDEIANFDFPHHAVALQRFRRNQICSFWWNSDSWTFDQRFRSNIATSWFGWKWSISVSVKNSVGPSWNYQISWMYERCFRSSGRSLW